MVKKVLIAYATKHGATAEIAEKIGGILRGASLAVEVISVKKAGDPAAYAAVILGSAVYIGQWRKEAAAFLTANEGALASRPVWLFSTGPTGTGDPVAIMKGWRFPENLQPLADRIRPRGVALFHGALDEKQLNLAEKMAIKMVKAPIGDFQDWNAVTAWGRGIAEELASEAPVETNAK
jgi:menaquinone-dependent protoporphyrinogen oxidase